MKASGSLAGLEAAGQGKVEEADVKRGKVEARGWRGTSGRPPPRSPRCSPQQEQEHRTAPPGASGSTAAAQAIV